MISREKLTIFIPSQKLPKNVGDLSKYIAANGFEKLPKVQYFAQSGNTEYKCNTSRQSIDPIPPFLISRPIFRLLKAFFYQRNDSLRGKYECIIYPFLGSLLHHR